MSGRNWLIWPVLAVVTACMLSYFIRWQKQHAAMVRADPDRILTQPDLAPLALSVGRSVFAAHCASCHGPLGKGDSVRGIPDLTDRDVLYGHGRVSEIEAIVLHGIRAGDDKGWNIVSMPAYGREKPYQKQPFPPLLPDDIRDIVQLLLTRERRPADAAAANRGAQIFGSNIKGACYDCHGQDGAGNPLIGAPNLVDSINLYGDGSAGALFRSVAYGRAGFCPAFAQYLSPVEARAVAAYTASLAHHATIEGAS
jgi:cytochrome c oxidase cbb3-type subunit 3